MLRILLQTFILVLDKVIEVDQESEQDCEKRAW
jgi:hypothetical protein